MKETLHVVSLSHENASLEIRELIYLPENVCRTLAMQFQEILGIQECLVFSTCNRTEVYYLAENDLSHEVIGLLFVAKGIVKTDTLVSAFRIINDEETAIRYLFEVSLGMHATVLGDLQIAGQVKQAYAAAHELKMAGPFLHRLMHTIFHANKRVQQETAFRDGAASVSYAAAELIHELTAHLARPSVLVIGLGEMGTDAARNLDLDQIGTLALANRTIDKTRNLAGELGAQVLPLEEIHAHLGRFDVVLTALGVDTPFLHAAHFQGQKSTVLIDLGVPRNIDPAVDQIPSVVRYDIDDIHARTSETLARREQALYFVAEIVSQEVAGFIAWREELVISPAIQRLKEALEQIRQEELGRALKKASPQERQLVEQVTQSMLNKILRIPVMQLKAACKRGDQDSLVDMLTDLFDLEKTRQRQS